MQMRAESQAVRNRALYPAAADRAAVERQVVRSTQFAKNAGIENVVRIVRSLDAL